MSRVQSIRSHNSGKIAKVAHSPRCAHCINLGLPYDHWLRASADPKSPIVCQVLLNTACLYCHALGHTTGHCSQKKKVDRVNHILTKKYEKQQRLLIYQSTNVQEHSPVVSHGKYASIYVEEEDDEETHTPVQTPSPSTRSWATIVKTAVQPVESPSDEDTPNMKLNEEWRMSKISTSNTNVPKRRVFSRSWADICDDSDSDDSE